MLHIMEQKLKKFTRKMDASGSHLILELSGFMRIFLLQGFHNILSLIVTFDSAMWL